MSAAVPQHFEIPALQQHMLHQIPVLFSQRPGPSQVVELYVRGYKGKVLVLQLQASLFPFTSKVVKKLLQLDSRVCRHEALFVFLFFRSRSSVSSGQSSSQTDAS